MTPPNSSAQPEKLFDYSAAATKIDGELEQRSQTVENALKQFVASCKEYNAYTDVTLAYRLRNYARSTAVVDRWVAQVASAFLHADQGVDVQRVWDTVDAYANSDPTTLEWKLDELNRQGVPPEELQLIRTLVRLRQIPIQQQLLADLNPDQLAKDATQLDAAAQAALDEYIKNSGSIFSPLALVDKQQIKFLAWLQKLEAAQGRVNAIGLQIQSTELEKERLELELWLAKHARPSSPEEAALWRHTGEQSETIAALEAQLAAVKIKLDGDPSIPARIAELERQKQHPPFSIYLSGPATGSMLQDYNQRLDAEIAKLRAQEGGLRKQYADAQHDVSEATKQLGTAQKELLAELATYQERIRNLVPQERQDLQKLRQDAAARGWSDMVAAIDGMLQVIDNPDPTAFAAAYERLKNAAEKYGADRNFIVNLPPAFNSDPRLAVMRGRQEASRDKGGFEKFMNALGFVLTDIVLLGIPSYIEDRRILGEPGGSPEIYDQANVGLALDYLGFILLLGGPLIKGVQVVLKGGKYVVEISDEALVALKAKYGPEVAARLQAAVDRAATLSTRLAGMAPAQAEQFLQQTIAQVSRGVDWMSAAVNLNARNIATLAAAGHTAEELRGPINAVLAYGGTVEDLVKAGVPPTMLFQSGISGPALISAGARAEDVLAAMGLPANYIDTIPAAERAQVVAALDRWNLDASGKNQGITHIIDYAEGAGGAGKENRLLKLGEYTGKGPFQLNDPTVISDVTRAIDDMIANLPPGQIKTVGDKKIYFIAKDGATPPFSNSQKGIVVIEYNGKLSTFMNTNYKNFTKME